MATAMDGNDGTLDKLAAFGRCVETSSLYIVLALDNTIGALQEVDQIARALALSCEGIAHEISMNHLIAGRVLDPAGKVVGDLWACHRRIDDLLPGLIAQSSALARMDVPHEHQRDLLNFAFERCIESFAWVIDGVKKVRRLIDAHNLEEEAGPDKGTDAGATLTASLQSNAA
jgi:hypothetical protein